MKLNLYNEIQRNLNESVGDFQNTSLSQPMTIINDSDNNDLDIIKTGSAVCDYTGGGIWVAYMPVKIDGTDYIITLDSESEQLDEVDGGEFFVCYPDDFNLVDSYGDHGVFVFDNNSKYMDYYNELKSVLLSSMNESSDNDLSYEDIALDNIYVDDNGMTSEEIIKNNIDLMAEDCAKQLVGDLMDDVTPETESLYNANLKDYEKEFKDYILNNIDTLVSSHNSQQSNLDNILGEAVESELKLSGKVSEILQQIQGKNYTGFEKVLNALNPNADVVVMYNTENKFLHIEIPNLAVLWDGKEPQ